MALERFTDFEQGTPAWFEARAGIVTASVVGSLITTKTMQPADNETTRKLLLALLAERLTGRVEFTVETRDMQRGTLSEPYARDAYSESEGVEVAQVGFFRRDEPGWRLGYSPDGVVGDEGLIECKAPQAKEHIRTLLADEVPAPYMPQCQTALFVTGRPWIDFVSFNAGMPLYVKRVEPIEKWKTAIQAVVEDAESRLQELEAAYKLAVEGRPLTDYINVFGEEDGY